MGAVLGGIDHKNGDNVATSSSVSSTTLKLVAPKGWYDGIDDTVTITDSDNTAANIKTGVNINGVTGTFTNDSDAVAEDMRSSKTAYVNGTKITGNLSVRTGDNAASAHSMATTTIKLTPPAGIYDGSTDKVTQNLTTVDADLTAANIKTGVEILGVTGTYTNDADAANTEIVNGKTAYVNGTKLTGTGGNAKRYASGSATTSASTLDFTIMMSGFINPLYYITVSGLTFTPSAILIWSGNGYNKETFYNNDYFETASGRYGKIIVTGSTKNYYTLDGTNAYTSSSGFRMPVADGSILSYVWEAYE